MALFVLGEAVPCRAESIECAAPVSSGPSEEKDLAAVARLGGRGHLVVWRDNRASDGGQPYLSFVDSLRRVADGWPAQGLRLGTVGDFSSNPLIAALGHGSAIAAWSTFVSAERDRESFGAIIREHSPGVLAPTDVTVDSITNRPLSQVPNCVVRQDDTRGLVVMLAQGGPSSILIKQLVVPGTGEGAWPSAGVALHDETNKFPNGIAPAAACSDDSSGCFVLAAGAIPIDMFHSRTTFLLFRFLPDGSRDPRWPVEGRELTTEGDETNRENALLPDGSGGAYVVWTEDDPAPPNGVRVRLQRVDRDGQIHAGWAANGVVAAPSTAARVQLYARLVGDGRERVAVFCLEDGRAYRLKAISGDGSTYPGWPDSGLVIGAQGGTPELGGHQLVVTDDSQLVAAWSEARLSAASPRSLYATSVSWEGGVLPGWAAGGNQLCIESESQLLSALDSGPIDSFTMVWTRGGYTLEVGSFAATDGALALGIETAHSGYSIQGNGVTTRWSSNAPEDLFLHGLRRVDGGDWVVRDSVQHAGAGQLVFEDDWPAGMTTVDYALGVSVGGSYQVVSDTLRITTASVAVGLHLEMDSIQSGRSLWMYLSVAMPGQEAEVRAFDVSGRCLATRKLGPLAGGTHRVELELPNPRQGIVFVRATSPSGASSARTALLN